MHRVKIELRAKEILRTKQWFAIGQVSDRWETSKICPAGHYINNLGCRRHPRARTLSLSSSGGRYYNPQGHRRCPWYEVAPLVGALVLCYLILGYWSDVLADIYSSDKISTWWQFVPMYLDKYSSRFLFHLFRCFYFQTVTNCKGLVFFQFSVFSSLFSVSKVCSFLYFVLKNLKCRMTGDIFMK